MDSLPLLPVPETKQQRKAKKTAASVCILCDPAVQRDAKWYQRRALSGQGSLLQKRLDEFSVEPPDFEWCSAKLVKNHEVEAQRLQAIVASAGSLKTKEGTHDKDEDKTRLLADLSALAEKIAALEDDIARFKKMLL